MNKSKEHKVVINKYKCLVYGEYDEEEKQYILPKSINDDQCFSANLYEIFSTSLWNDLDLVTL